MTTEAITMTSNTTLMTTTTTQSYRLNDTDMTSITTGPGPPPNTTTLRDLPDPPVMGQIPYISYGSINGTEPPEVLLLYNQTNFTVTTGPWLDPASVDVCSNISNETTTLDYSLAEVHHVVAGGLIFVIILPLVLFDFRILPIGTTSAVLLGALMMVLTRVVKQDEVYEVIGRQDYLTMLLLLLGMMLLAQYIEREQMLVGVLRRFLKATHSFENYVWRVCVLSFVLSAIFSSDACCAILTPVVLKIWEVQERPRTEQGCILLAIATSANIGSVTTIFGAPHMALIAAHTSAPLLKKSQLDMRACFMYLLPTALIAFLINLGFLVLHYRLRNRGFDRSNLVSEPSSQCEQEMAGLTNNNQKFHQNGFVRLERNDLVYEGMSQVPRDDRLGNPCQLETILEDEILEISSNSPSISAREGTSSPGAAACADSDIVQIGNYSDGEEEEEEHGAGHGEHESSLSGDNRIPSHGIQVEYRPSALQASRSQSFGHLRASSDTSLSKSLEQHGLRLSQKAGIYRSLGAVSAADFLPPEAGMQQLNHSMSCQSIFSPGDSSIFQVVLCLLLVTVFGLLLASTESVPFDIGLVPISASVMAIVTDSILNRRSSFFVLSRVDWSIIIMFFGVFVWIQGLNNTRLPRWVWNTVGLTQTDENYHFGVSPEIITIAGLVIVLGSTLFSHAPLTLMVLDQLVPCANQLWLILLLAWCSTIAGNLTLFNSVANLIVVQKGMATNRYRLTFCNHLQFGFLTTLIILPVGVIILYGLMLIPL